MKWTSAQKTIPTGYSSKTSCRFQTRKSTLQIPNVWFQTEKPNGNVCLLNTTFRISWFPSSRSNHSTTRGLCLTFWASVANTQVLCLLVTHLKSITSINTKAILQTCWDRLWGKVKITVVGLLLAPIMSTPSEQCSTRAIIGFQLTQNTVYHSALLPGYQELPPTELINTYGLTKLSGQETDLVRDSNSFCHNDLKKYQSFYD